MADADTAKGRGPVDPAKWEGVSPHRVYTGCTQGKPVRGPNQIGHSLMIDTRQGVLSLDGSC